MGDSRVGLDVVRNLTGFGEKREDLEGDVEKRGRSERWEREEEEEEEGS